jgi:hypothetical protein
MGRRLKTWTAGVIFFEETVSSERYLIMLHNTFVPQLLATGLPLQTQWFMQDGARPYTENVVLEFLHDTFDSRVISNRFPDRFICGQNLTPNSSDLNPCDYSLLGFLKEMICPKSGKE